VYLNRSWSKKLNEFDKLSESCVIGSFVIEIEVVFVILEALLLL